MPDLGDVREYLADETGLATFSTTQADGRVLSSIANCGVIDHPLASEPYVALVSMGRGARLGAEDGRTSVLVSPERIIGNAPRA